jgi:hypothetical protein
MKKMAYRRIHIQRENEELKHRLDVVFNNSKLVDMQNYLKER